MKTTKRLLALLLTLLLALSIAPAAFAETEEENGSDECPFCAEGIECPAAMPLITTQPKEYYKNFGSPIKKGEKISGNTFKVIAYIPDSSADAVGFRWYRDEVFIGEGNRLGGDSTSAVQSWPDAYAVESANYHVVVYNRACPQTYIVSEPVYVEVYVPTTWQLIEEGMRMAMGPFGIVLFFQAFITMWMLPISFLTLPVAAILLAVTGVLGLVAAVPAGLINVWVYRRWTNPSP